VLLKVSDVMTAGPRTCSPFSTAVEAALLFRDGDCGVLPVVDAGKPVGVLTDRDLALALPQYEGRLPAVPVSELMSKDPVTVRADDTLQTAVDRLSAEGVRRLLVVGADGALQGVLSWTDLVGHVSERGLGHVVARIVANR
jgi:CBS domain-containing protein